MQYGCDELKRVTSANFNQGHQTFTYDYDQYGNRWSQVGNGGITMNLQFNAKNQVTTNNYDAAGNVSWDGVHNYTYDAEGNVLTVDGGSTATYTYNALDQRVRSAQGSAVQEYVYNLAGQRVSTWNGTNHAQIEGKHYWGAKPVAFYSNGSLHFEHQDWLGTERLRTTYSGATEGVYTSGVWGDGYSVVGSGSDLDPNHFASLDHDGESNTDHATFRQYSAGQGHWMSPDPYDGSYDVGNPQSLNRYSYVVSNPLGFVDLLGLGPQDCENVGDPGCDRTPPHDPGPPGVGPFPIGFEPIDTPPGGGGPHGEPPRRNKAPNNGRTCTAGAPSGIGESAARTGLAALLTAQFFTGTGRSDVSFGVGSIGSQAMATSAGVTAALGDYQITGRTSGLYTFGVPGLLAAGNNSMAQFVGSFTYSITQATGGVNISLSNYTSVASLTNRLFGSHSRSSYGGFLGTTHQSYSIYVPCK